MSITVEPSGKSLWFSVKQKITGTKLYRIIGIDRAIAFTILARGWASLAGLVTLALITRFLSPDEQGYYYTFGSLIALQIVFELGFSFVVLQMASHERAHLTISTDNVISGDPIAHDRLASVFQKTLRWYTMAAALLAAFLLTAGARFFSAHQHGNGDVSWRIAWYSAALAATLTFQLDPLLSFMEGCGFVANVARLRLAQAVTGSVLAWLTLMAHHGLFAPAMIMTGNAAVASIWLYRRRRLLLSLLRRNPGDNRIHWGTEVWSFQWRIAVSWLCGYFIFQLYNPVLFAYKGAVAAGQMGMALSIANALSTIALSWVNTKAAPFGALIARKDFAQLDHLFFRASKQSVAVCVLGGLTVWTLVFYLNLAHSRLAQRILDPASLGMLLGITTLNIVVAAQALYLRAHKQEKLLVPSVLGALLISISTYYLGRSYGALGMVSGSLVVALLVGIPMATYTFIKYRRSWHG